MTDVHSADTRSRNMSAVKGKNTKPELLLRKMLFGRGFRFRLHREDLPGEPDIVLPKFKAVIFVHGCFWHGHIGCPKARLPATNQNFWKEKITTNQERDQRNTYALSEMGWRVLEVWECALRGRGRLEFGELSNWVTDWICCGVDLETIEGNKGDAYN
ncbi:MULTISPECIES: very short patch repair endonuclease [Marinobacter]|uniref:very short patch repair endonuclease n=1 Tax=Marinobacter TaxID=2742 RepID=UPI0029424D89|nr:very short patch repair endonuclease [Marinobacter salarius]WOI20921.1 very short patch repair endonuclease [Marinobacter salarius]